MFGRCARRRRGRDSRICDSRKKYSSAMRVTGNYLSFDHVESVKDFIWVVMDGVRPLVAVQWYIHDEWTRTGRAMWTGILHVQSKRKMKTQELSIGWEELRLEESCSVEEVMKTRTKDVLHMKSIGVWDGFRKEERRKIMDTGIWSLRCGDTNKISAEHLCV